jgi:hypothetical protein
MDVLSYEPAKLCQALPQCCDIRNASGIVLQKGHQHTDAALLLGWLRQS